jgi:hypothetical protein
MKRWTINWRYRQAGTKRWTRGKTILKATDKNTVLHDFYRVTSLAVDVTSVRRAREDKV